MAVVSVGVASASYKRISRSPFAPSYINNDDFLCRLPSSFSPNKSDFFSRASSQFLPSKKISRLLQLQQQQQLVAASASAGREVYQPFRPPLSKSSENLSVDEQIAILAERRGLWFDYAVHVSSLIRAGFTPSMIDEATGMTGVEQNKIVVASQVRSSLQSSGMDESTLACFDIGGPDILYELRILSGQQRKSAAEFALKRKMDPKDCRDLARAMKDYERRRREEGWDSFSFSPGDCLAFACYRQSKECKNASEREAILNNALNYADSEKARTKISTFLQKGEEVEVDVDVQKLFNRLPVLRLTVDEDGTWSMAQLLPVVNPTVQEIEAVPAASIRKGPFNIQHSDTPWHSWIALPGWEPLTNAVAPFAVSYLDASFLPWKPKSKKELEEPIVLLADKHIAELHAETYFIVAAESGKLGLQLGTVVAETQSKPLGRALLALRPPLLGIEDCD